MARMFDACTAGNIPADAAIVAGYVDGRCQWSAADWARFPGAIQLGISSLGTDAGQVLDVEPQNPSASYAPTWIRMRQAAGVARPVIYCAPRGHTQDGYAVEDVQAACQGLEYDLWVCTAGVPGQPHSWPGAVACQYALDSQLGTGYDLSETIPGWPSTFGAPPVTASATWNNSGGDDMVLLTTPGGRADFIHVGTDYAIWHRWKSQNFGDIATENESWGAPAGKRLVKVSAAYDDGGQTFDVVAAADDGTIWALQMNVAGGVHNGWWPIDPASGRVLVATTGQPGPAGPPGPDVRPQIAAALEAAAKQLQAA